MYQYLTKLKTSQSKIKVLPFVNFAHGLNTSIPNFSIKPTEYSALINWVIKKGGQGKTREAISKYTTTATLSNSAVKTIASVNIGSTNYTLIQDANHKVYYLDSDPKPVLVGTLAANAQIIGYNGVAILMDGDYLKYMDSVSEIKIAYDGGTGANGFQFDNTALSNDDSINMSSAGTTRAAQKFTSQTWTAGYTIPPTMFYVYLSKTGSPTGDISMVLRKVSDDSILATKTLTTAEQVGATASEFYAGFAASDITTEMSPGTAYYMSVEFSGGDAANEINVHVHTETSGGLAYEYYGGAWHAVTTQNILCSLSPGRPPKASFGAIKDSRLWLGGDPDNPGYVWYSNLTHLDWSTPNGGGYIGAVDDHKDNYTVGGLNTLYGDLIVYGTQAQPYLAKLSGTSPTDYQLPLMFQRTWTTQKALVGTANDLWAGSGDGVDPVSGVVEYGDLRTFSASDPIQDRLDDYWDSATAFAAYYPKDGQYWLVMPSYHRVVLSHTKIPAQDPSGIGLRYPWAEYEFYRDIFTRSAYKWTKSSHGTNEYYLELAAGGDPSIATQPDFLTLDGTVITEGTAGSLNDHQWDYGDNDSLGYNTVYFRDETGDPDTSGVEIRSILLPTALASVGSYFLIGGSDGFVYQLDDNEYKDLGLFQISPKAMSAYIEIPFGHANFSEFHLLASSIGGGQIGVNIYADGKLVTAASTTSKPLSAKDGLTVDEALMDVDDAYFLVNIEQVDPFEYVNFNARAVMLVIKDVLLSGYPIYLDGAFFKYRELSY